jgi:hypothetical protein
MNNIQSFQRTFIKYSFFSRGVRLSPLGNAANVGPNAPAPDENDDGYDDCGAIGGMRIGKGN